MQITDRQRFKTSAFLIQNGIPFNAVMSMGDDQRLGWAIAFDDIAHNGFEWPLEEAMEASPKVEITLETAKARAAKNGITFHSSMELPREPGGLWW